MTESRCARISPTRLIQRSCSCPSPARPMSRRHRAQQYAALLLEQRGPESSARCRRRRWARGGADRGRDRRFLPDQPRPLHHPRAAGDSLRRVRPRAVAAQAQATEAEIQAAYRPNRGLCAGENPRLSQVVLPQDEAAARALAQKVAGGTSFAAAAAQAGRSAADTARRQPRRGRSPPKLARRRRRRVRRRQGRDGRAGPRRRSAGTSSRSRRSASPARPLEAVRGEIAAQIQREQGIETLSTSSQPDRECDRRRLQLRRDRRAQKLAVKETPPVTAAGAAPGIAGWQAPAELQPLLEGAFALEPGEDPGVEAVTGESALRLVAVARGDPGGGAAAGRDPRPGEGRSDRPPGAPSGRGRSRGAIVAKINAGTPPAQAFAQAQVHSAGADPSPPPAARSPEPEAQVPPPMAMMFSLPRGKARLLPAPDGRGWFVVYLDRIVPGDARKEPGLVRAVRGQFGADHGRGICPPVHRRDPGRAEGRAQRGGGAQAQGRTGGARRGPVTARSSGRRRRIAG